MRELEWLMEWYAAHCDGDWEHMFGVKIETLDNRGWSVTIDLEDTELEDRPYELVRHDPQSEISWWICRVEERKWLGGCAPDHLITVLGLFRDWATGPMPS